MGLSRNITQKYFSISDSLTNHNRDHSNLSFRLYLGAESARRQDSVNSDAVIGLLHLKLCQTEIPEVDQSVDENFLMIQNQMTFCGLRIYVTVLTTSPYDWLSF